MRVEFTKDAEKKRVETKDKKRHTNTWEYYSGDSIVEATRLARDMGWKEYKVQVRYVQSGDKTTYYVEPFEDGCGCRGILKYKDFFD